MKLRIGYLLIVFFSLFGTVFLTPPSYAGLDLPPPSLGASDCEGPSNESEVNAMMPSSEIFWVLESHEITYDQNFGPWQKNLLPVGGINSFNVDDDTSGAAQTFFNIIEIVTVGEGSSFTDWHEEIVNPGWVWQSGEISIPDSETVEGEVDGNTISFFFDEALVPGTEIEIEKEFAYVGLDGNFDSEPIESSTISDIAPLVILQFPTVEDGCNVLTPPEMIQELIDTVTSMDLRIGTEISLISNLDSAIDKLEDGNPNNDSATCGKLDSFVNKVNAQDGKNLTTNQADLLRGLAEDILDALEC